MNRLKFLQFLCIVFLIGNSVAYESSSQSFPRSPSPSLLSISSGDQTTTLIATLDGTIYLVENNSGKVIWSFSSGPQIYSAYQQSSLKTSSSSSFFIDCGDDWKLYMHTGNDFSVKLPESIDDFLKIMPLITEDGAVTLGSKKTTVFEVDHRTGRLLRRYVLSDSLSTQQGTKEETKTGLVQSNSKEPSLRILRTDYALKSFVADSDKVSWSMSFAEIATVLVCQDAEKDVSAWPVPCQKKVPVLRHRSHFSLELVGREGATRVRDQSTALAILAPTLKIRNERNDMPRLLLAEDKRNGTIQRLGYVFVISIVSIIVVFAGLVVYRIVYRIKDPNSEGLPVKKKKKKKKNRKSEMCNEDSIVQATGVEETRKDSNNVFESVIVEKNVGKVVISKIVIAKGSNGTIIREGLYEGRTVAVKCLVRAYLPVAFKEINNLRISDHHPNIVRFFGHECDDDFVYISMERCTCSLDDLIQIYSDSSTNQASGEDNASRALFDHKARLESIKKDMPKIKLWKENGHPSPLLIKLMRDVVYGLAHLHELDIIHRDLKPQNILITKKKNLSAKLSDMGISKQLEENMSALDQQVTGCGTSGWQAREHLLKERQTRAVDLFSLGCVLFFCITGGKHPYGDKIERDVNILNNSVDLFLVECLHEALDLISRLLNHIPELRPKASEVLCHPLFWDSEMRLSFLRETSDRLELEDRENGSGLLQALENSALTKWNKKMHQRFLVDTGRYRRNYDFDSLQDLLRFIRNKLNHYGELAEEIQDLVGKVPEGFDDYFSSRFPKLIIDVYNLMKMHCNTEDWLLKYISTSVEEV